MATMKLLIVAFLAFLVFVDGHVVMNMVANKGLGDGHKAVEREGLVKEESENMTNLKMCFSHFCQITAEIALLLLSV